MAYFQLYYTQKEIEMLTNQQLFGGHRRSLSSQKCKLLYFQPQKKPTHKYLAFASTLRNFLSVKISSHFNSLIQHTRKKVKISHQLNRLALIAKMQKFRIAFRMLRFQANQVLKKNISFKIISNLIRGALKRRKKQTFQCIRNRYFNKELDKAFTDKLVALEKWQKRKIKQRKREVYCIIKKKTDGDKRKGIFMRNTINNLLLKFKLNSFMRINMHNLMHKSSNLEQPPTIESQQNIQLIQNLEEEEEKKGGRILKKCTSDSNIQSMTERLKDNLDEKSRRSLSRKSRVSSLMDDDFTNILIGSLSSKDYGDYNQNQGPSADTKIEYYKNTAKSYKKQLEIIKSQLEVMKQMNHNYENQIEDMVFSQESKEIKYLKSKIQLLKKQKQKYKEKVKGYEQQIVQMKGEFKNRMQKVHMRVKKQL